MDDADDCRPGGHDWVLAGVEVSGLRLRQTRECAGCGAIEWAPSVGDQRGAGETVMESRQPLFSRRAAHDEIG